MNVAESYQQPYCPQCRNPLRLILQEKRWFCDRCKSYVDVMPLSHVSHPGTKEGKRTFSERLILMLILVAVMPAVAYFILYLTFLSRFGVV